MTTQALIVGVASAKIKFNPAGSLRLAPCPSAPLHCSMTTNSKPKMFNPKFKMLIPESQTFCSQTYTLHPLPINLNPVPQNSNLNPFTVTAVFNSNAHAPTSPFPAEFNFFRFCDEKMWDHVSKHVSLHIASLKLHA